MSPDRIIEAALDPRESRRTRIARRFTILTFFVLVGTILVVVLYTVSLIRQTQLDNRSTLETTKTASQEAKETGDRVKDCTEPNGQCFAESQRRTIALVQQIVDEIVTTRHVSVLAAACSTDPLLKGLTKGERINAIDLCVQAALKLEKEEGRR